MNEHKNTILFIVLSAIILLGWQLIFGVPQMQQRQKELTPGSPPPVTAPSPAPQAPTTAAPSNSNAPTAPTPATPGAPTMTREQSLAQSPRVAIETPRLAGSIALRGGRIDDLSLTQYHETVDPSSPPIVLLSPSGSPNPFYAEFGWLPPQGVTIKMPDENTMWSQQGTGSLRVDHPVTLAWDNGEGLEFRRTIAVDDKYLFTVKDEITNKSATAVTLYPYALISRHGTPKIEGYYVSFEGLTGVLGGALQEEKYSSLDEKKTFSFPATHGWLGITDKYWAATLVPDPKATINAQFTETQNGVKRYQTSYSRDPITIAPGATAADETRLFAGAKEVSIIDGYTE